jgi:hypothetical protein
MVRQLAQKLVSNGYSDVRAAHVEWPGGSPVVMGGFCPDITAVGADGAGVVIEIETEDSYDEAHTADQLAGLMKACQQMSTRLILVVPEAAVGKATGRFFFAAGANMIRILAFEQLMA